MIAYQKNCYRYALTGNPQEVHNRIRTHLSCPAYSVPFIDPLQLTYLPKTWTDCVVDAVMMMRLLGCNQDEEMIKHFEGKADR